MPLFPIFKPDGFVKRHKLIRRLAAVAGTAVGMYFLGKNQGWW